LAIGNSNPFTLLGDLGFGFSKSWSLITHHIKYPPPPKTKKLSYLTPQIPLGKETPHLQVSAHCQTQKLKQNKLFTKEIDETKKINKIDILILFSTGSK